MKRIAAVLAALALMGGGSAATADAAYRFDVREVVYDTYHPWCGPHYSPFHKKIGLLTAWWCENDRQNLYRSARRHGYSIIEYSYVEDHWTHWYQRWVRAAVYDGSDGCSCVGVIKWAHWWTNSQA